MIYRGCLVFFVLMTVMNPVLADDFSVEVIDEEIPAEFSEAIRAQSYSQRIALSLEGKVSAKIWLIDSLKSAATPSSELGVTFGSIQTGSFVGVIELVETWGDYKANPIQPGLYTMRYEIMPADGNHMGVATYRDFLIFLPAEEDQDPAQVFEYDDQVALSFGAAGVPHPAVMALYPIWEEVTEPKLVKNDLDQWTVGLKIGDKTLGLIVEGHGEIH